MYQMQNSDLSVQTEAFRQNGASDGEDESKNLLKKCEQVQVFINQHVLLYFLA